MLSTAAARAYLGLCLASVCWAAAFIAGKVVLAELTPLSASGLRHLAAALVLAPFAWRARHRADLRAAAAPLLLMIVAGGVLYQWTFMAALQRTSATNAALLVALNPALTVLLAPLVGEPLTRRALAGVLIALGGAAVVITQGDLAVIAGLAAARPGDLLALAAASLWATFNLASRRAVTALPHALTNAVVYGGGSLITLLLAAPEAPLAQLAQASVGARAALAFMVLGASVIAGQLFLTGVHTVGVGRTVVFVYLVPVLTALFSAVLLDEALLPAQLAGGVLVLAGVWLTTRPARVAAAPPATAAATAPDAQRA